MEDLTVIPLSLQTNPDYQSTFVFNNDFAALLPDAPEPPPPEHPLLLLQQAKGTWYVHNGTHSAVYASSEK